MSRRRDITDPRHQWNRPYHGGRYPLVDLRAPEYDRILMDINAVFPSKYLKAADLQGNEVEVEIEYVEVQNVGGTDSPEDRPVIFFRNKKKGLVLNKTNANTISGMFGPETDHWSGQHIRLFPTQTDFAGKQVPCIRVRLQQAKPVQTHTELDEDSIPFDQSPAF